MDYSEKNIFDHQRSKAWSAAVQSKKSDAVFINHQGDRRTNNNILDDSLNDSMPRIREGFGDAYSPDQIRKMNTPITEIK
jgi:hypothetical protein